VAVSETAVISLLGCGTVGSALLRLLEANAEAIHDRSGYRFDVRRIAVRDGERVRDVPAGLADRFTTDASAVVGEKTDVIVEVMGGTDPALPLVLEALRAGKHVVTANKALLASHGPELFETAADHKAGLYFEAAVAGGIPLIGPLRDSLAGERITRLLGIVNGTTNYVLTRMTEDATSFESALAEATRLGYAEADPSADIEGLDAAAKCAILASIAFNTPVTVKDVYTEGIVGVSPEDIEFARRLGYTVKLLAVAESAGDGVTVRVHPAMIPEQHPLSAVRDAFNAVFVEGPHVGELMFYGPGAGGEATAVSVLGDLITAASDRRPPRYPLFAGRSIHPIESMETQYYLLLDVADRPGVLAQVAGAFGDNRVSIKSVWQEGTGDDALLVLITHRANEGAVQRTVRDLRALDPVLEVRSVMRVAGEE
jgi:homoserine dehydrogenase